MNWMLLLDVQQQSLPVLGLFKQYKRRIRYLGSYPR